MVKTHFPKYEKKSLSPLYQTFKKKDKQMIEEYLVLCGGTAGKTTINKYASVLTKICDVFEGELDNIDLKRLRSFLNTLNQSDLLPPTKNEIRKVLKRFLKENYDDWSLRFKQLKDIRGEKEINQNKINADTILTLKEIESLVRGANNLKYKALIMLFYESAGRPEEILNLKWSSLNLDKGEVKLRSSKTGNVRINPLSDSIIHLKRYKQEYPFINVKADDWVFPNPYNRERHQSLVGMGIYIKRLGKKVLDKDVFPYLIRHTRATQLQKVLPAKIYEKFMDHSTETATRYSHLNKDDVRQVMLQSVYNVEELSEDKRHILEKKVKILIEVTQHLGKKYLENLNKKDKNKPVDKETLELLKQIKTSS